MAEVKAPAARPLSPHLQIYRWSWTMAMSIAHRVTGGALYVGTVLLAIWLVALAAGPRTFAPVQAFFGSVLGQLILLAYTFVLMQHMLGGVRHLIWDFGEGMDRESRMNLARLTPVGAAVLTVVIWVVAYLAR